MGEFRRIGVAGLVAGLAWAALPPAAWAADVTPVFDIVVNQIGEALRDGRSGSGNVVDAETADGFRLD